MTKLVSLRVTVAADDTVEVKDIKPRLIAIISAAGTEPVGENGINGRVHWVTAEVLQGPDKVNLRRPAAKRAAVTDQGVLGDVGNGSAPHRGGNRRT